MKTPILLLGAMFCCSAVPQPTKATRLTSNARATIPCPLGGSNAAGKPDINGNLARQIVPARPSNAILGAWLLLAAGGALVVAAAGRLMLKKGPGPRDPAYLALGGLGYMMLLSAAVGLVLAG